MYLHAKMYPSLQFFVTTVFMILAYPQQLDRLTSELLNAFFALYIIHIGFTIYRGIGEPPQLSDSEDDGGSTSVRDEQMPGQSIGPRRLLY